MSLSLNLSTHSLNKFFNKAQETFFSPKEIDSSFFSNSQMVYKICRLVNLNLSPSESNFVSFGGKKAFRQEMSKNTVGNNLTVFAFRLVICRKFCPLPTLDFLLLSRANDSLAEVNNRKLCWTLTKVGQVVVKAAQPGGSKCILAS